MRELKEELRLLRGEADDRGPLTAGELQQLQQLAAAYCADQSADAQLAVPGMGMMHVRALFGILRDLARGRGPAPAAAAGPGAGTAGAGAPGPREQGQGGGEAQEQVKRLRLQVGPPRLHHSAVLTAPCCKRKDRIRFMTHSRCR